MLDGGRHYRVTFPAGALPPARAFWSLTIYDERHALPDGDGRHAIGSHTPGIELAADGSLSILVGPAPGGAEGHANANRLVTPTGPFSLYLRVYWPEGAVLDGSWTPPPARPVDAAPVAIAEPVDGAVESTDEEGEAVQLALRSASASSAPVEAMSRRAGGGYTRRPFFGRTSDREVVRRR
jgi:hypothetical protein